MCPDWESNLHLVYEMMLQPSQATQPGQEEVLSVFNFISIEISMDRGLWFSIGYIHIRYLVSQETLVVKMKQRMEIEII